MIRKVNLEDAFRNALLNNPKASRKEQFTAFLETVRSNPVYSELLAEHFFYLRAQTWEVQEIAPGVTAIVGTPAAERRAQAAVANSAEAKKRADKAEAELAAKIRPFIWLEMEVNTASGPKKVRHCTGAELAKVGGIFTEISKRLKPTQVVDKHFSEADLRNIATRFDPPGGGKRRAASGAELHA